MKKVFAVFLLIVFVFTIASCADNTVKGSVVEESADGNAILDIMPQKLMEQVDIGDTVVVTVGDFSTEMPFVDELIPEDGKTQLLFDQEHGDISICIYNQRFCEKYDIDAGKRVIITKK